MDEEAGRVEVVVPDEQLSLAIGRRGQNVRLASQLTRWDIDILTEAEESERRQEEFRKRSSQFVEALDVDDVIAGLLVTEGFHTIEELAYTDPGELNDIEGFDESVAEELMHRANDYLASKEQALDDQRKALGVTDDVAELGTFTNQMLVTLGEKGVKTLDDLADLAGDELVEILGEEAIDEDAANEIIMAARAHWFDGEEADSAKPENGDGSRPTSDISDTDNGPVRGALGRRGSERRCIVTREQKPPEGMIRFVVSPDNRVVPDLAGKLPGRECG